MIKIHYRNSHGTTNLPWQNAFRKYGELSLGSIQSGDFPEQIDHLHLGGSCKGSHSSCQYFISVEEIKEVQKRTNCSISVFYGDPELHSFRFHHELLDTVPRVKIYSAALYGTSMWRDDINWVLHPTSKEEFPLVKHKKNEAVLFVGHLTEHRREVINDLKYCGIKVDTIGTGGMDFHAKYGKDLAEFSKNYTVSIGIPYNEARPKKKYCSTRLPNSLAMGLVYLESDFDLTKVFDKDEIIQWDGIMDLVDKIKFYQQYPIIGTNIILKGRQKVLHNWTFDILARRFLKEGGMDV